jgi:putative ATP-grasp target RiPP
MTTSEAAGELVAFPLGDQFPLSGGSCLPAPGGPRVRPFGLRFARVPARSADLDLGLVSYDDVRQIAVARDGDALVPLAGHRMGLTLQTTGQIPREDEVYDKT